VGPKLCTQRTGFRRDSFPWVCARSTAGTDQRRNDGTGRRYASSRKEQRSDHQPHRKNLLLIRGVRLPREVSRRAKCKEVRRIVLHNAYSRPSHTPPGALLTRGSVRHTRQSGDATAGTGLEHWLAVWMNKLSRLSVAL